MHPQVLNTTECETDSSIFSRYIKTCRYHYFNLIFLAKELKGSYKQQSKEFIFYIVLVILKLMKKLLFISAELRFASCIHFSLTKPASCHLPYQANKVLYRNHVYKNKLLGPVTQVTLPHTSLQVQWAAQFSSLLFLLGEVLSLPNENKWGWRG